MTFQTEGIARCAYCNGQLGWILKWLQEVIELSKITKLRGMSRTLGAAPAASLSLCERLIMFAFGSFHLRCSNKLLFLW